MPGTIIQRLWSAWEFMFHKLWRVRPISEETMGQPYLIYISEQRYYGHPFTVDGVSVSKRDKVIELHMNNELVVEILRSQKSAVGIAVRLLQEAKRAFPVLAQRLAGSEYNHIQAIYGVTFINRSLERFGFHVFPIRRKILAALTTWYLKKLFVVVNPKGRQLIEEHPDTLVPRVVAISRARLLTEFPPHTQDLGDRTFDESRHVPS